MNDIMRFIHHSVGDLLFCMHRVCSSDITAIKERDQVSWLWLVTLGVCRWADSKDCADQRHCSLYIQPTTTRRGF